MDMYNCWGLAGDFKDHTILWTYCFICPCPVYHMLFMCLCVKDLYPVGTTLI